MTPWRITLTGIDASCQLEELVHLTEKHPALEWGILYSRERAGAGRYPTTDWIASAQEVLHQNGATLALHVCGTAVGHLLSHGALPELRVLSQFDRVQLNGRIATESAPKLISLIQNSSATFITQYDQNPELARAVGFSPRHQYLFDASGGRGVLREQWPSPIDSVRCGYAGGLSPDNLAEQLPLIAEASGDALYWVDMESGLRTADDRFSAWNARKVLSKFEHFCSQP